MNMTDGGGPDAPRPNNSASTATAATAAAIAAAQATVDKFLLLAQQRGFMNGVRRTSDPSSFLTTAEVEAYLKANKVLLAAQEAAKASATTSTSTASKEVDGETNPTDYKWNLPPHSWSLPVRPMTMEPDVTKGVSTYKLEDGTSANFHNLRRGRLWFFGGAEEISTYDEDGNVTDLGAKSGATSGSTKGGDDAKLVAADRKYGFQFLWNPSAVSTSVSRNDNVTPSSADRLKSVVGAFPGQETVQFSLVIDRVNDFACLKAEDPDTDMSKFSKYYGTGYPGETEPFSIKIKNLMEQGTMADLEYLFKSINGGSDQWVTLLGKRTAAIGFLMPTLLGLVLGPSTTNNLSYVGWLTGLTMQHEMFTESMIPLRTTVSINMECFAGSGIVNS
jgi:hypothetical protein